MVARRSCFFHSRLPGFLCRFFASCALFASPLAGQNEEILGSYTIGVVGSKQEDAPYQATLRGAVKAAEALGERYSIDIEVLPMSPRAERGETQVDSLRQLFREKVDGILLSPAVSSSGPLADAVRFALRHNQEIAYFERDLEGADPLVSILADERMAGRLAAEVLLERLPERGRVAILTAREPDPVFQDRLEGARATLGYRRIEKVVRTDRDYRSAIRAIRAAEEADRDHTIDGWIFLADWPLTGQPALPWEPGSLPAVAIQSSPSAFIYIDRDYLDALVVHPYYEWGESAVEHLIEKLHNGEAPEKTEIRTEPRIVDWRNVEAYREKWKAWLR